MRQIEQTKWRDFKGGPLRLWLGILQMSLAAAGIGAFAVVGIKSITIAFVVAATVLTIVSRFLYHGGKQARKD